MKNKLGFVSSMAILFVAGGLILLGAYWLLWPYDVLKDTSLTITNQPYSGGDIQLLFGFTKTREVVGQATVKLINEYIVTLIETPATQQPGKWDKKLVYKIPENVPPGQYKIQITTTYQVNPLRTTTEKVESELFAIK